MSTRPSDHVASSVKFEIFVAAIVAIFLLSSFGQSFRAVRLPIMIGSITLVLIAIDLATQFRKLKKSPPARNPVAQARSAATFDLPALKKMAVTIAFMAATILLWNVVGYILTSIAVIIGFGLFLGVKGKVALVLTAIGLSGTLYLVFGVVLGVPLPWGLLSAII